ncbi:MAG: hypothetical protein MUC77_09790 [Chromatiaceae bacterium]|jgi:hypothetical protein|nr:hypothetical protein [Chromatiaceae bacterium]
MKTIFIASALTLATNLAFAHDYQWGNFAGPDLTPGFSTVSGGDFRPVVKSNVRVSLQDYYAGNPDVFYGHGPSEQAFIVRIDAPTSVDEWYAGNPDVIGRYVREGGELITRQEAIARVVKPRDGGV